MKLLVTGGAGFIGSNFVRYMRQAHPAYGIVNVDLLTYAGNPDNLLGVEAGSLSGRRRRSGVWVPVRRQHSKTGQNRKSIGQPIAGGDEARPVIGS